MIEATIIVFHILTYTVSEQQSMRFSAVRNYFSDDRLLMAWMAELAARKSYYLNTAQICQALVDIQTDGLFGISTNVALLGEGGSLMLNGSLRVSLARLVRMKSEERVELFALIRVMYRGFNESALAPSMRQMLAKFNRQRLVFEHQRHEAVVSIYTPKLRP